MQMLRNNYCLYYCKHSTAKCTKMILPAYNETADDTFATNVPCFQRLVVTAAPISIDSDTVLQ
jgi:hypothetical protein